MKESLILSAKGMAMGLADVVPGVSGGTIAFISGIYEELLNTIRSLNLKALAAFRDGGLKGFWSHINGSFLLFLGSGIILGFLTFSRVILFLLAEYPQLLFAFFFGLVGASIVLVFRSLKERTMSTYLSLLLGAGFGYFISSLSPAETPTDWWFILLSGAIAICAMILPGLSGSFLLLLLGKYEYILESLHELRLSVIALFGAGCVFGLLGFSHVLSWAFRKYHDTTVAILTGFLIGTINKVWPWKQVVETFTDRKGRLKPLVENNVLPFEYLELTGRDPRLGLSLFLMVGGFFLIILLEKYANKKEAH